MTNETQVMPIYMDYSATTPVDPRVAEKMIPFITESYGNPASRSHPYGWTAEKAVENARIEVAKLVNADPREIIWTSGATESNNLARSLHKYPHLMKHFLFSCATEHKAVIDAVREMERMGYETTFLQPEPDGLIDIKKFKDAIRPDTVLACVMMVNNEIGVIQDIDALGKACRAEKIIFHVDAAQATGKVEIDLEKLPVDLMSFSAHKTYGPKGIGALYVRRKPRVRIEALIHGGGHERGMSSGTLATHQIVGMGEAIRTYNYPQGRVTDHRIGLTLYDLQNIVNGDIEKIIDELKLVQNTEGESLIMAIKGIAVSSGSACTSASLEPSYVLRALGRSDELAHSSIRFSIGRFTKESDIDYAIKLLKEKKAA